MGRLPAVLSMTSKTHFGDCCLFFPFSCYDLQTVKGGISETRIEKRIVITGDADIDHDQVKISGPCSENDGVCVF